MAGCFISFEGGEGCGKSTQIERLALRLKATGREVVKTREPGGTPLGEAVRQLLQHDSVGEGMCAAAELLLFAASRAQHVEERIRPALDRGAVVLCDRFMDSTTVYQGIARQIDAATVARINQFAVGSAVPDLTVLIDLDPEVGLQRIRSRAGGVLDRMESETLSFFEAVRQGYLALAEREPGRFAVLDGDQDPDALEVSVVDLLRARAMLD